MPLAIDHDDTQLLNFDSDSPHSEGDEVFVGGETLPIDFGETERVDSCDEQAGEGFQDWGKTQVVEQFEETEVLQDEDEDEDDLMGEVGSGLRATDGELVDPDASTDEDDVGRSCDPDIPTAIKASCMETMPFSESVLNIAGTKMNEIVLDHDAKNSFSFIEDSSRDNYLHQKEETELRSELKIGKMSSQSPLRCNQAAAGLSYISSQEPGAQSQAIALGFVDKFLSVNDEGLPLDFKNENTDKVISLPIASVKRAQCFVRKTDKSTAGKVEVYDWIDSLEDEGGGELFSRRKNSFFDCKGSKEVARRFMGDDKKSTTDGAKSRTWKKLASLAKSKKLFHELKKQTNTDAIEQLEDCDVHVNDGVYSCGPATQMAAEAIQALGNSSPIHFEPTNLQSRRGEVTSTSAKIKNTSKTCSRRNSSTRKSSKPEVMARSKLPKTIPKSRAKSRNSSRKQSSKLRRKIVLEDSTTEIAAKVTVKKTDKKYGVVSVNNGENAVSVVGETVKNMVEVEMPPPVALRKQPPVGAKCIVDTSEMYTSPVAHRTRGSKRAELLNLNKALSNDPCNDAGRNTLHAHRTVEMDDAFVSNLSVVPEVNKTGCNISLIGTINSGCAFTGLPDAFGLERVRVEETDVSHDPNPDCESKRKVKNIDKENQSSDRKMYNRSNSANTIPLTAVNPAIQTKKRKVFIRSFAEILDSVKRRKRSVSSSRKLGSDGLPSDFEKIQNESVCRTRPSLLFDILKPYLASDPHFKTRLACKPASDGTANTYSLSAIKHIVDGDNLGTSKENGQCRLLSEDVNETTKPEVSPVASSQSVLRDSLTLCKSQETPRSSFCKSSSRSPISRELTRLETSYASPSKLNDVRRRKDMTCFQVCFSNHLSKDVIKQQKKILKRLGIQYVSCSLEATHFVADKFVRTRNMLEAMAMGKPVVTPMWLESCGQASSSIDEKNYILRDSRKEKEIGFSMPVSLARAQEHPLLQGKMVFIAPNVKPNQELISSLVKIAGGQPLKKIELPVNEDDKLPDNLLILAGEEDFAVCAPLLKRGVVFSSELLLNGIVIQKLESERHQLFLNQA